MENYKELEYLRKHTILWPIERIRVENLKRKAARFTSIINQKEHCHLGVDYSEANELEFELRFESWRSGLYCIWEKYVSQNMDFIDFAKWVLSQNVEKELENERNAKQLTRNR